MRSNLTFRYVRTNLRILILGFSLKTRWTYTLTMNKHDGTTRTDASSSASKEEDNTRFADFAMQVLSVQRFFAKSKQEDPFLEKYTNLPKAESSLKNNAVHSTSKFGADNGRRIRLSFQFVYLDPFGSWHLLWLFVVSLGVAYCSWTIILRLAFIEGQGKSFTFFLFADYATDFVFLLDIWIQSRTAYMENGLLVIEAKQTRYHYMHTFGFGVDCLAVIPFDLLYFVYGINPVFRLGRLIKIHRFVSFNQRVEVITHYYNFFNLTMLVHHVFLIIHWVACMYFLISKSMGYGSDVWVYPALRGEWAQVSKLTNRQ